MGKKRGRKGTYETYGGQEIADKINGKDIGISLANYNQTYYVMIPQETGRTKRKWLGKDLQNAVLKFRAIVAELKGIAEPTIKTTAPANTAKKGRKAKKGINYKTVTINKRGDKGRIKQTWTAEKTVTVDASEQQYIEWLKNELQNPQELAKKTGLDFFNHVYDYIQQEQITLKELYENYTNSKAYKKAINEDEKQKSKMDWDLFCSITGKTHLEQITLADTKKFETYLHNKNYADKTISHHKNRVLKVFRMNLNNFEDTTKLQIVINHFAKWEKLETGGSATFAAQAISYKNFMILYNAAKKKGDLQLMAVLMLCLNTGTYLIEVARFKLSEIDLDEQTLMTKRNKKGKCLKIAYLWDRTVKDIKAYLATRKDASDILFKANHGGPFKNGEGLRTNIYKLRKDCKLLKTVEFSHLRDTFQTISNEVGVTQFHSNLVMGHSTGKTSERYSHRRIHNELKESCLKVENKFFKAEAKPKKKSKKKATKKKTTK